MPSLSIVIPAYNESARIGPTLAAIVASLRTWPTAWDICVVDDGSTDDTAPLVEAFARAHPEVTLRRLPVNRGKGAAVRDGMLAARGDRILFCDADLATPMSELLPLWHALDDGADIAIGSRALAASRIEVHQHPAREFMGRTFNGIVRTLTRTQMKDTQCGFKLFTRAAAHDLFRRATIDGFAFDVEVLWLARHTYRVAEIAVTWRHVEQSKVSPGRDALRMLRDTLALRWRHRHDRQ